MEGSFSTHVLLRLLHNWQREVVRPSVGNIISESICEEKFDARAKKPSTSRRLSNRDGRCVKKSVKSITNEGRCSLCERKMTVLRSNSIFRVVTTALHFEE